MLPEVSVENLTLSKIVCGTNQFVGITHRWNPIDMLMHLRRFKDPGVVAKFMIYLFQELGINCTISSPRDKVYEAIKITEKEIGERFHWICSPSRRKTAKDLPPDVYKQIDWCVERDVSVCLMQRGYVDKAIDTENLVIGGDIPEHPPYEEISAYIRDKGMIPGMSSHLHETIKAIEKNNYDVPLLVMPYNKIGYLANTDINNLIKFVHGFKGQFLAIKPMAAGRVPPKEGIHFTLDNIRENDLMSLGFGKFDYCVEDGKILEDYFKSK